MHSAILLGQAIIGLVFLVAIVNDILERNELMAALATKNIPYREYLFPGAIGLKLLCGLGLVFNILAPVAAFFLAGFTLVANIIFNNFWAQTGADRKNAYFQFIIHMAIVGGLIALVGA